MKRLKMTALLTAAAMLLCTSCSSTSSGTVTAKAFDLMADIQPQQAAGTACDAEFTAAQNRFALNLLQKASAGTQKNLMLSPYSVMQALAMTANGAGGDTKTAMTEALGGLPVDALNSYLYAWRTGQPDDASCRLKTANSVWIKENTPTVEVSPAFLQVNADYYGAGAFRLPFDDKAAGIMNGWVKQNTDEMIPEIIDEIPADTVMYLINATAFDAKWASEYDMDSMQDCVFHLEDGTKKNVKMMYSEEEDFLSDDRAKGFRRLYAGGRYAFAALLPEQGLSVDDYVQQLTPERLQTVLNEPVSGKVRAGLPKFTFDYDAELSQPLTEMGMGIAFSDGADFSGIQADGGTDLYISRVLHKTHIDVNETGTKAAAATAAEISVKGALPKEKETVVLDRPFVCAILDLQTGIPVFLGIVREPVQA